MVFVLRFLIVLCVLVVVHSLSRCRSATEFDSVGIAAIAWPWVHHQRRRTATAQQQPAMDAATATARADH